MNIHVVSHSHWDREWYLPFEAHRYRLIKLIDDLLISLESDGFASFHLDGQTILLDDYLAVKPENREKLEHYIREGRLVVGPWYILQDEFLTSAESNIRNLLIGMRAAQQYGRCSHIGYFPDAFGNAGQMPQLLKQAGMDAVVFGRGVKPVGFNNEALENSYDSSYSEVYWDSPDGSRLLGILFANWYNNGAEVPTDPEASKAYWDEKIREAARFASTKQLLLMNGGDHQPVQRDLAQALSVSGELFPQHRFIHSNFPDYVKAVQREVDDHLTTVTGELTSQMTDGWTTLTDTASSRIYLKQMNQRGQMLLERRAEPLSVLASCLTRGYDYPSQILKYAWKTLMQNHPHDSICACSVDEVCREMETRFAKSASVAGALIQEAECALNTQIHTSAFRAYGDRVYPVVVWNSTGRACGGPVRAFIDLERDYGDLHEGAKRLSKSPLPAHRLMDETGKHVPASVCDLGVCFGYDLPTDTYRKPYMARRVCVEFEADAVPSNGWRCYALVQAALSTSAAQSQVTGENTMENDSLRVEIKADGSLAVTIKETGVTYTGIAVLEDCGDMGNEYIFMQTQGAPPVTTRGVTADVRLIRDTPFLTEYAITHRMNIPVSAAPALRKEREAFVPVEKRTSGRSTERCTLTVTVTVTLLHHAKEIALHVSFDNNAEDHRLRMLISTQISSDTHVAESIFEAVRRPNTPSSNWRNPSNCQRKQAYVYMERDDAGVLVAAPGLPEYEILPSDNTIAVTLLRAVGEMGDWGVFPTPEAQCLRSHEADLLFAPFFGQAALDDAIAQAYLLESPLTCTQTGVHDGPLPASCTFLSYHGEGLVQTTLKKSENGDAVIARWYSASPRNSVLCVQFWEDNLRVYKSNVIEDALQEVFPLPDGQYRLPVGKAEIITLRIEKMGL
ncbi:MAG: alpha-mannosidase [Acetanaerobacterium sp.]